MALYMVIERFRNGDAVPVYRRFQYHGHMEGDGLNYVSSWIDESFAYCYQLMETDDRSLLDHWMSRWDDLVEFEVHAVMTSREAFETDSAKIKPGMKPDQLHLKFRGVRPESRVSGGPATQDADVSN